MLYSSINQIVYKYCLEEHYKKNVILLYFLRVVKHEVARDEDIFFATIGLLYSCILIVHGWRLDPILLFSQVLIIASLLVAGWENIRLRGLLANMAKLKKQ